jgi:hypothetical protein
MEKKSYGKKRMDVRWPLTEGGLGRGNCSWRGTLSKEE